MTNHKEQRFVDLDETKNSKVSSKGGWECSIKGKEWEECHHFKCTLCSNEE